MICKKIMLGFLLGLISLAQPAFAVPSTADRIMVHDMDMINQQRFRMIGTEKLQLANLIITNGLNGFSYNFIKKA